MTAAGRPPADARRRALLGAAGAAWLAPTVHAQPVEELIADIRLYFGTSRTLDSGAQMPRFGVRRDRLRLGVAEVALPVQHHQVGRIERPSRLRRGRWTHAAEHVHIERIALREPDEFFADIEAAQPTLTRDVSLFVHGYRVHFGSAALRAAQLCWDTQFGGLPLFYSWPSLGTTTGYFEDRRQIPAAQADLQGFLALVAQRVKFERLHVIAHSMGTHITTLALAALARTSAWQGRIGELVLAAPDIPIEDAAQLLEASRSIARRVTLYVSAHDPAMKASRAANRQPSLGDIVERPSVLPGVDTVDATHTDTHFFSHGYLNKSREVIEDLGKLIRGDLDPEARGLRRVEVSTRRWWQFTPSESPAR
jgi:esterase/lipase superfamily enzyme